MYRALGSITLAVAVVAVGLAGAGALPEDVGFAISRVGNAIIRSERLRFRTIAPVDVSVVDGSTAGDAASSTQEAPEAGPVEHVVVNPVEDVFPQLAGLDRERVKAHFETDVSARHGWSAVTSKSACAESFIGVVNGSVVGVSLWGVGTGAAFRGTTSADSFHVVSTMLAQLELDEGECGW